MHESDVREKLVQGLVVVVAGLCMGCRPVGEGKEIWDIWQGENIVGMGWNSRGKMHYFTVVPGLRPLGAI